MSGENPLEQRLTDIEGQAILLEVLERDGHDVSEQREQLQRLRQEYARGIAKNFRELAASLEREGLIVTDQIHRLSQARVRSAAAHSVRYVEANHRISMSVAGAKPFKQRHCESVTDVAP